MASFAFLPDRFFDIKHIIKLWIDDLKRAQKRQPQSNYQEKKHRTGQHYDQITNSHILFLRVPFSLIHFFYFISENISSMLQDIRALRHTEIDYINGFLLRRARAHGIAVPENTRLFEMVKRKESEYERIGTGLPRPW